MKRGLGLGVDKRNFSGGEVPPNEFAQAFFSAQQAAVNPVTGIYLILYNNLAKALQAVGYIGGSTGLDRLCIRATGSAVNRGWALMNFIDPTKVDTVTGGYSGDLDSNGFIGNGAGFKILQNWNPGDGGTYKFKQNNASYGVGLIKNNSTLPMWELGSANAGFTSGNLIRGYTQDDGHGAGSINGTFFAPDTYQKPIISSYSVLGWRRTVSNLSESFLNGVRIESTAGASSAIMNQKFGEFDAYNGSFTAGAFQSTNQHSFDYAGDSTVDQGVLMTILNRTFFGPLGIRAAMTKRIIFEGDSRTSDTTNPELSNNARYPKRVLTALGDNWVGTSVGKANDSLAAMIASYASEIGAYVNLDFEKNICSIFGGTNSIAAGLSAAQCYSEMKTLAALPKADGFKVVIYTEIDRNWTSYVAMNIVRSTYNASLLADFATSVGTNLFTGAAYADVLVNLYAEVNFQSYLSSYYQIDGIHPSDAGSDKIGDYLKAAIDLL